MRGDPADPDNEPSYSYPLYRLIADTAQPYAEVLAKTPYRRVSFGLDPTPAERIVGESVSGNYFSALRVDPALGRVIGPGDDTALGGNRIAILSYAFWTRRFAADRSVLGRTIYYKETPYTVAGVAARGFSGVESEADVDVWVPASTDLPRNALTGPNFNALRLLARLRPGADPARFEAVVDRVFRAHLQAVVLPHLPLLFRERSAKQHVVVRPAGSGFSALGRKYERPLLILLAVVALVLLISCANVANLILGRHAARAQEIGVRLALGASRTRIFGQLFVESLILAAAGAGLGMVVALWGCRFIVALLPPTAIPVAFGFGPNFTVLGFTAVIAILTALLFGIAPALRAIRGSSGPLVKSSGRATRRSLTPRILVAGQLAITLLLLIGAGLFLRTIRNFHAVDLGFPSEHLTTFSIALPRATPPARIREAYASIRRALLGAPGTVSASYDTGGGWSASAQIEGRPALANQDNEVAIINTGPGWFETVNIRLVSGRYLTPHDGAVDAPVAVVNARLARRLFGDVSPLGRRIKLNTGDGPVREIVGVIGDAKYFGVKERQWPTAYLPSTGGGNFLVRTAAGAPDPARSIRSFAAAAGAQVDSIRTFRDLLDDSFGRERMVGALCAASGALATLLAAVGMYGVLAYGVSRRTAELGIRMALGASRGAVERLVLRQTAVLIAIGSAVGLAAAFATTRLVGNMLYGIAPVDGPVFAAAFFLLIAVAALAGYLPARRASRIDPMTALRHE
jgi:predicted permease